MFVVVHWATQINIKYKNTERKPSSKVSRDPNPFMALKVMPREALKEWVAASPETLCQRQAKMFFNSCNILTKSSGHSKD